MAILSHLRLRSFRNYETLNLDLCKGLTLLVGANGQGKSNLLEAVCYLSLLRSFRSSRIQTLRRWSADHFFIGGTLSAGQEGTHVGIRELAVSYGDRRQLLMDGNPVGKTSEFINAFRCIVFAPEDIELVKGAAKGRRRFLDILLSQLEPLYLYHLQRYTSALKSRNAILRDHRRYPDSALAAYNELLVEDGSHLMALRGEWLRGLADALAALSDTLLGAGSRLMLQYIPSIPLPGTPCERDSCARSFRESLQKSVDRDRAEGHTRVGPHRDDVSFLLGDRQLVHYGSEGECRMACLALRLASLELLRQRHAGDGVVALVDDVVGELDPKRRERFFSMLASADQILMTTTELPPELEERADTVLHVEHGGIHREDGKE